MNEHNRLKENKLPFFCVKTDLMRFKIKSNGYEEYPTNSI